MRLAELNVGRTRHDLDAPEMAGFMDNLDRVNAIADRAPGFVWRMQDEAGNATGIKPTDDPRFITNLSVWEDFASFEHFVWNTLHKRFLRRKAEWFEASSRPYFVMWYVEEGHQPTLDEALARLADLTANGPSDRAFGWERFRHPVAT
jgi:hypothetical protein